LIGLALGPNLGLQDEPKDLLAEFGSHSLADDEQVGVVRCSVGQVIPGKG